MTIFERFATAFRRHETDDVSQPRREALVDLLVWAMFVDHHLALAEHEKLAELTEDLPWDSIVSLSDYLAESVARARDVLDDEEAAADYLESLGERLGDRPSRRRAFVACEHMAAADGKLVPEEAAHLRAVAKAFDLR